jgi:hypothetical protein
MKAVKDLKVGEVFFDSFGLELTVLSIKELSPSCTLTPKVRIVFKTQAGNEMFQSFRSDRKVEVKK